MSPHRPPRCKAMNGPLPCTLEEHGPEVAHVWYEPKQGDYSVGIDPPLTEQQLAEIEDAVSPFSDPLRMTIVPQLIAEVRRLRSLFSEEDAEELGGVGCCPHHDEMCADLARRIREAIGAKQEET